MKIPTDLASSSHSLDGGKVDHPCYPTLFLCYLFAFNKIRPLPSYLSKMRLLSIECSLMGGRIGLIFDEDMQQFQCTVCIFGCLNYCLVLENR